MKINQITESSQDTYNQVYQIMVRAKPEFMYRANNQDVKKAILKAMSFGTQISVNDLAAYAYGLLKSNDLNEFAPAGGGGGNIPRGPRTPGGDFGGGDDSGEDPYRRPEPEYYSRSIDYFGQFEADHFDDEEFDKDTGVFKGYWDDAEGRVQIGYFKFDDPAATGSDDPGMGWYYEPQNESVAEDSLNEFAPGSGGGESGRWYTDDQMTDIVGDGWWNDLDVSGNISKQQMIQEAQAWLDDQGYSVQVLNCRLNDDDMDWYIEGNFHNPGFAKKGVAEGIDDEDYGPELAALQKEFGKFTTHYDRMEKDPSYAARYNKQQTDRQNRDMPNDAEDDYDAEDDFMSDRTHNMAEGQRMGEYGRVLSAIGLYVPDKFSMEELNTPDWHRVIASKADVPVEYAGKVIDDFTRPVDDDEYDDDENVSEAPGAETLAHNQSTVASNEKAFDLGEGKPREKEADYGDDYQDMVARVKKLAGLGPLRTVYDPQKRVYKNVPVAVQPAQQPKK